MPLVIDKGETSFLFLLCSLLVTLCLLYHQLHHYTFISFLHSDVVKINAPRVLISCYMGGIFLASSSQFFLSLSYRTLKQFIKLKREDIFQSQGQSLVVWVLKNKIKTATHCTSGKSVIFAFKINRLQFNKDFFLHERNSV